MEGLPGQRAPQSAEASRRLETSPAQEAANALGDIGNPAVPGLLAALGSDDWKTRKFAAVALGDVDGIVDRPRVVGTLIARLTDRHPDVRDRTAWALGEIEDKAAVEPLLSALNDSDPRVRARAAWALGEIEDRAALTGLTRALNDTDRGVREKAAWALREIEDAHSARPATH
jgi:HEAT repeat protein